MGAKQYQLESDVLLITVCAGQVDLFLASSVLNSEVAVVEVFLDVLAVTVVLLVLLEDHLRV